MTYAITAAAQTTVPVTWTTQAGTTATAHMPTLLHASYAQAAAGHTQAVVQIADAPQQVTPAVTQTGSPGGGAIAGLSGATLLGLGIVVWFAAKWKTHAREVKRAFVAGAAAIVLIGSWGLFGTLTQTVKSTGDNVGNSVSTTIGQQTSAR
ncbi:hypothetical protein AB0O91_21850 [Kitasatospora sp. NPDC089797]|uniref:hypothetical protein n=1 Tax=Kitasatospora sp. NPDC089797 TaxID=3155298 RepID=UPI0034294879